VWRKRKKVLRENCGDKWKSCVREKWRSVSIFLLLLISVSSPGERNVIWSLYKICMRPIDLGTFHLRRLIIFAQIELVLFKEEKRCVPPALAEIATLLANVKAGKGKQPIEK